MRGSPIRAATRRAAAAAADMSRLGRSRGSSGSDEDGRRLASRMDAAADKLLSLRRSADATADGAKPMSTRR